MNKKIILILIVAFAVFFIAGVLVFQYINKIESTENNSVNTEKSPANSEAVKNKENKENKGSLIICADKCGDGICQISNEDCGEIDCICLETPQDCPKDCQ